MLRASSIALLSLLPNLSILRKALDKIAEIKSLLEERRIGELETSLAFPNQVECGFLRAAVCLPTGEPVTSAWCDHPMGF